MATLGSGDAVAAGAAGTAPVSASGDSLSDAAGGGLMPLQPLVVHVQILRETATSPKHDVSVRRVQGTSWRFQNFYVAFRSQMSHHLGLGDYTQLSLFSPMVTKRTTPAAMTQRPSSWFAERGSTASGTAAAGGGGAAAPPSSASVRFKRSKSPGALLSLATPSFRTSGGRRDGADPNGTRDAGGQKESDGHVGGSGRQ